MSPTYGTKYKCMSFLHLLTSLCFRHEDSFDVLLILFLFYDDRMSMFNILDETCCNVSVDYSG